MHGSTENQRNLGQFQAVPQPQPQQVQVGSNDEGQIALAIGGNLSLFEPAQALALAATITGLVGQQLAKATSAQPRIVTAGVMPQIVGNGAR